jgi:hypothetical protein
MKRGSRVTTTAFPLRASVLSPFFAGGDGVRFVRGWRNARCAGLQIAPWWAKSRTRRSVKGRFGIHTGLRSLWLTRKSRYARKDTLYLHQAIRLAACFGPHLLGCPPRAAIIPA